MGGRRGDGSSSAKDVESSQKRGRAFKEALLSRWACKIWFLARVWGGFIIIIIITVFTRSNGGTVYEVC